ncbi:DUF3087 family protein [Rheinheimera sp.]|uniref:DUF3087 family protein n=1 Tax=Rheinheimera sp. TaxID=1869214 RepID=UPI002FDD3A48
MQIKDINKDTYRSHLNVIIVAAIAVFAALGVGLSSLLIHYFGGPQGDNFIWNLLGVSIGGFIAAACLKKLKHTPYFYEVAYVWDLKQELNLINRKLTHLKQACNSGNVDAMIIMLYNYHGSRQLWQLDDNVLNLQELELELIQLEDKIRQTGLKLDPGQYQRSLLDKF